ncbi:MAG: uracil-DNA glycosylase [Clostridiales bacterium]|nr:uracil-DNA glycosylase [Clostridiales bacterium]
MQKLYDEMREKAGEAFPGRKFIGGEGNLKPRLVLIGEAPGGEEEKQGRPFVGKAGKNLSEFLEILGLQRESIYITNVVKLRPVKISPKTGRASNRPPNKAEVEFFTPYLYRELEILRPEYAVTLGNFALRAVKKDKKAVIGELHGRSLDQSGFTLFPLYHPASIIYNRALKDTYIKDIEILKEILQEKGY